VYIHTRGRQRIRRRRINIIDAITPKLNVNITVLGGLAASGAGGVPLALGGRKALALLAYLSLAPGFRASREKLSDLLWPDRSSAQGRNNLRQTLSMLRRAMPEGFDGIVQAERDFITLVPGSFSCDALQLIEACERPVAGEARTVAELYRGPFLDGFFSGSDVFDDWASFLRVRLQASAVHALSESVRSSETDMGLAMIGQLLTIDPTREATYQLAMELYSAKWQHDQALRYYEACKAMLTREFGVRPSPETERIRKRILESRPLPHEDASPGARALPASCRSAPKTVLVSEFQNLTGDSRFSAFVRGLTDAVAIELSQVHEVAVVQAPAGGGSGVCAAELVLGGSVLAAGGEILVMARLSHGESGRQLTGERFQFSEAEQFRSLADISQCLALSTRFESLHSGWQLRDLLPIDCHPVRLMVLRAHCRYYELTDAALKEAIGLCEQALAIEPNSLRAQRMLSLSLSAAMNQGLVPRRPDNIARAIELARQVARAVPEDVFSRCVLGWALGNDGQHGAAVEELKYAIGLNPTYATLHSDLAEHYAMLGYLSEALAEVEEAIRLTQDDVVSFWRYYTVSVTQFAAGNHAAALENARRVMRDKPGLVRGGLFHAASAAALGLKEEAQRAIRSVLADRPGLTLDTVAPGFMPRFVQDRHHAQFLAQLEAAGLPR
jgi:DNA-binding SARP family transcriptional activator/tetratricopeptide (TPR) repeat protein